MSGNLRTSLLTAAACCAFHAQKSMSAVVGTRHRLTQVWHLSCDKTWRCDSSSALHKRS